MNLRGYGYHNILGVTVIVHVRLRACPNNVDRVRISRGGIRTGRSPCAEAGVLAQTDARGNVALGHRTLAVDGCLEDDSVETSNQILAVRRAVSGQQYRNVAR